MKNRYDITQTAPKDYYGDKVVPQWEMIGAWARSGLSNPQIAKNIGIGGSTMEKFVKRYEELKEWIEENRVGANMQVENALFKRATGYQYREVTKERKAQPDGTYKRVVTKVVVKEVPPDVGAAQWWLERRDPNRWPRIPVGDIDTTAANAHILGLAQLIAAPVKVREKGSENE